MKETWVSIGAGVLIIERPIKYFKRKAYGVETYVFSNCEHVEFIAKDK